MKILKNTFLNQKPLIILLTLLIVVSLILAIDFDLFPLFYVHLVLYLVGIWILIKMTIKEVYELIVELFAETIDSMFIEYDYITYDINWKGDLNILIHTPYKINIEEINRSLINKLIEYSEKNKIDIDVKLKINNRYEKDNDDYAVDTING